MYNKCIVIIVVILIICFLLFYNNRNDFQDKPRIIDAFSYNGEIKALKLRLKELDDMVDNFVIVEALYTFSGLQKELKFPIDKQQIPNNLLDKVMYIVYNSLEHNDFLYR